MSKRGQNSKRGQVTLFVILAILIVVAVLVFIFLYNPFKESSLPKEIQPVYDYYLTCLEEQTKQGAVLMGEQGGYIYSDEVNFVEGSDYIPFSSHLNFFGQPIPYWFYVSGNNIAQEQKPTISGMEKEMERYVSERTDFCDFRDFYEQGYSIIVEKGSAQVDIEDSKIVADVKAPITILFGEESYYLSDHKVEVSSSLGKFYKIASDIYEYEMEQMFLENYSLDVMWLYAPVSGVEMTCSPLVFNKYNISEDLRQAFAANIQSIKLKGDYYSLKEKEKEYFVKDIGKKVDENVNFIYSPSWTTKIEIYGDEVVKPVGLQPGMQMLGFCYVPYKFVYDIDFPVMVQIYSDDGSEIFQFPMAVIIRKNQAREAISVGEYVNLENEICPYANKEIEVFSYDSQLDPIETELSFKCLDVICPMGKTKISNGEATYKGLVPECVNGFVLASAEGYAEAKEQISTNEENSANVVLRKKYKLDLDLGKTGGNALVSFVSDDYSATAFYPEMDSIELVEGYYNVSVQIYSDSALTIPATKKTECVDVPKEGFSGLLGLKEEKCFDLDIPEMKVEMAVTGGGKTQEYLTEGMLMDAKELNINVPLFDKPKSLEELQTNFLNVDRGYVYVTLQ